LLQACRKGDLSRAKQLLAAGADPDAHDGTVGTRPLHCAACQNNIPITRALLSAGADINARKGYGGTERPLESAAQAGNVAMVRFLIAQGAELNVGGVCPALTEAAVQGHAIIVDLLISGGAHPQANLLSKAMWSQNVSLIERLIRHGVKVVGNGEKEDRAIVSMAARQSGGPEIVRLIAKHGANLKASLNSDNETPLHKAQHEDTALFLIQNGVDINAVNRFGETPLHTCAQRGFVKACNLLLELGADPRAKTLRGYTPRMAAKLYGKQATFDLLTDALKQFGPKTSQPTKSVLKAPETQATHTGRFSIPKPAWETPSKCASGFIKLVSESFPEFAVFAVRSRFASVVVKGEVNWPKEGWQRNVDIKSPEKADAGFSTVGLLEIRNNPWTIILVSMWENDAIRMIDWATKLSKALRTTAVTFCSGDGGYQLTVHSLGELQECITWCGGGVDYFKSTFRKRPKLPKTDEQIADQLIGEHGIYFAPCYPCELNTKRLGLAVAPEAKDLVVRADLLEPGRLR
jgi:ankyrin repeat protein